MDLNNASSPPMPLLPHVTFLLPGLESSQKRKLFHHFMTCWLPIGLRSHAHPGYTDISDLYRMGLQLRGLMDIYLGIAALHISMTGAQTDLLATQYYDSAVSMLKNSIERELVEGTEESVLNLTMFLFIFEKWTSHTVSNAMIHLEGMSQLFKVRKAIAASSTSITPLQRISAESFIYNIATMSLFHPYSDKLLENFSWSDMAEYFQKTPFPGYSEFANSPVLGSFLNLYRLVFEVTRLSRHTPLQGPDLDQALGYEQQLISFRNELVRRLANLQGPDERDCLRGALLYALTLQIFLFKVLHISASPAHPIVQRRALEAFTLVRNCSMAVNCSPYFCWPLSILACAVTYEDDVLLLRERLGEIWKASFCGHVKRVLMLLEDVWERAQDDKMTSIHYEKSFSNGLDRLLHAGGLLDTIRIREL